MNRAEGPWNVEHKRYILGNRCFFAFIETETETELRETGFCSTSEVIIQFLLTGIENLLDTTCVKRKALGPKSARHLLSCGPLEFICLKT